MLSIATSVVSSVRRLSQHSKAVRQPILAASRPSGRLKPSKAAGKLKDWPAFPADFSFDLVVRATRPVLLAIKANPDRQIASLPTVGMPTGSVRCTLCAAHRDYPRRPDNYGPQFQQSLVQNARCPDWRSLSRCRQFRHSPAECIKLAILAPVRNLHCPVNGY